MHQFSIVNKLPLLSENGKHRSTGVLLCYINVVGKLADERFVGKV
jgi:hypothetical protein